MPRRKTTLTRLPTNPRGALKIPKPQVKSVTGTQFSQRAVKAQVGLDVPGVKTR